jgi:biopolymer transport protein ExbD
VSGRRALAFRSRHQREDPEINFIPLIDLLLVILIFLMVTTTYTKFTALGVELPSASTSETATRAAEIVVMVSADNRYLIDGPTPTVIPRDNLAREIARAASALQQPTLVIHADAGASHQSVVSVLEAARESGVARVTFAARSTSATGKP